MFLSPCQKCNSSNILEDRQQSITGQLLKVLGFQALLCTECGFRRKQLLPLNLLLNAIYVILFAEICFLLWGLV